MVFNVTFNIMSFISWESDLLVEETGVPRENHLLVASHWQILSHNVVSSTPRHEQHKTIIYQLVLMWAQLTKIYPPLPTSVQPISITKTLLIVPTKNERDPPLFTGKLLIKFQNILRNTIQVIIRHRVKILFSVISSPITLEWQKWKSSKMKGILLSSSVSCW
jgi:hypothetical protein